MLALARGTVMAAGTSPLIFYAQQKGTLVEPVSLEFAIYDVSDDTKKLTPAQVFPAVAGTTHAVDIAGADKLGVGRYTASGWTVPSSSTGSSGLQRIKWVFRLPPQPDANGVLQTQPLMTVWQDFEVLAAAPAVLPGPLYCLVSDLRDEGVTTGMASDAQLLIKIIRAGQFAEKCCGRFFEPRYLEHRVNGKGNSVVMVNTPIIGLESLRFQTSPLFPSDLAVEPDFYRVYNRHLDGVLMPDDRNNPKIELFSASEDLAGVRPFSFSRLIFPRGQQNVKMVGVFGYTDADGTPFGRTPELLRRAVQLLTLRDLRKLTDWDRREESLKRSRIISERTRDQQYNLDGARTLGLATSFTGDPEIDQLLSAYVRPPMMGAA